MVDLDSEEIKNLLKEKEKHFKRMLILTEQQTHAIDKNHDNEEDSIEELINILDEKDYIIDKIDKIDLKLKGISLDEYVIKEEILSISLNIKNIINKIRLINDKNDNRLNEVMSELRKSLKDVRQSKKLSNNYNNSDPYQAFANQGGTLFIDQDS